jgi:hypothetical protein
MKKLLVFTFFLPLVGCLHAQQDVGHGFTVGFQSLTRGEMRYGGFSGLDSSDEGHAHFVIGRYRLTTDYNCSWLEARMSLQQSGTWGMSGGSFGLYEGWVKFKTPHGWFAKIGRQVLAYDDERIIGSNDWSMTAPTHDVLKLAYEGNQHKVHALLAYNQNPENMDGFTYYSGGVQPYKSMQTLWYHYDSPKTLFGASLLFMNIGMQDEDKKVPKVHYQQLAGAYLTLNPGVVKAVGSFYYQFGKEEHGLPLSAYMGSIRLTAEPSSSYSLQAGYDYLSGDAYFAVPPGGSLGLVRHDTVRGFNPIYGSHHEFYGAMDFYYMSAYVRGFTPGLQNAYVGGSFSPVKNLDFKIAAHYYAMATTLPNVDKTLGYAIDLSVSYALTKDVVAECGYSYMHGTETMEFLKRVSDSQRLHWAYLMLVVNPTIFSTKW